MTPCIVFPLRWLLLVCPRALSCGVPHSFLTLPFLVTVCMKKWLADLHSSGFCWWNWMIYVFFARTRLRWRWTIQHPDQCTTGNESSLVTRGTERCHRLFQEGQTCLNSVVVCCSPPGFWAIHIKPMAKQPFCMMSEALRVWSVEWSIDYHFILLQNFIFRPLQNFGWWKMEKCHYCIWFYTRTLLLCFAIHFVPQTPFIHPLQYCSHPLILMWNLYMTEDRSPEVLYSENTPLVSSWKAGRCPV